MTSQRLKAVPIAIFLFVCSAVPCLPQEVFSVASGTSGEDNQPSGQEAVGKQQAATPAGTADLQKAVQNPVASLISVPIQNNSNFGIGPFDRTQNVLNIQPVIPMLVSENWNLIIRWIAPIIWQPAPGTANLEAYGILENTPPYFAAQNVQQSAGVFGFGDMTPTFFLSPAKPCPAQKSD